MKWNREVFQKWERLRFIFCLTLAFFSLTWLRPVWNRLTLNQWMEIALGAVILNLLFLIGPALEHLMQEKGWDTSIIRLLLFIGGTFLSVAVIFFHIAGLHEVVIGVD